MRYHQHTVLSQIRRFN